MNKVYLSKASASYTAPQSQIALPLKYELWKEIFIIRVGGPVISLSAPTPEEDPLFLSLGKMITQGFLLQRIYDTSLFQNVPGEANRNHKLLIARNLLSNFSS
jgi:hypothetical protein